MASSESRQNFGIGPGRSRGVIVWMFGAIVLGLPILLFAVFAALQALYNWMFS